MVGGIATWIAGDDNHIAGPQRFPSHALLTELSCASPFHGPALHFAFVIGRHHMHERMRITPQELDEFAFDSELLTLYLLFYVRHPQDPELLRDLQRP